MSTLLFQGEIGEVKTRKDRTIRLTLESSMEITDPLELAGLFGLRANSVYVAIKDSNFNDEDVNAIPEPQRMEHEKSPALRLRNVLFLLWKQQGEKGNFEVFYQASLEKLINQVKEKLT